MDPQKSYRSSMRSAEEMSITPNTDQSISNLEREVEVDQSIANLEREVDVDIDTIGEQLSDLNAFLNSHFLRPKRPLYRQCRDLLRRSCRDFSFSR